MKIFKLPLVLVMLVVICVCSGCNSVDTVSDAREDTFSYWVAMPAAIVSQYSSMAEMTMYKELEKETGVKIEFIHPPAGQDREQFNLMVASRDLPDIIEYYWSVYPGGPEKAIEDKVIVELNDIIEQDKSPNFKAQLESNAIYNKQSKTDNGSYYGFPMLSTGKYKTFGGLILRQDWLDELALEVPETLDEWEHVLTQFRDVKKADAPFTCRDNIFDISSVAHTFNNAYDVGLGFYVKDNKISFAPMEAEYKEFIGRMKKWYSEGLLDKEYSTNNQTVVDAKMTNGSSGACYGFIGGTIGKYITSMAQREPSYNLVAVQHPVMTKGDEPNFMEIQHEANAPFLTITAAAKDPAQIVEWADYLYSEKGNLLKNFGIEGLTYEMVDGEPVYTDLILNNPEGLSISEAMTRHFRATSPAPGFGQSEIYLTQYYAMQQQRNALDTWSKHSSNAEKTALPPITALAEEADELSGIMAEATTYVAEMVFKFIQGSEPMENYDAFVQTLKSMGIERAVELQQNALDRYYQR